MLSNTLAYAILNNIFQEWKNGFIIILNVYIFILQGVLFNTINGVEKSFINIINRQALLNLHSLKLMIGMMRNRLQSLSDRFRLNYLNNSEEIW